MNEKMFKREPVTLDGYVPAFTREETLLGYKIERVRIGGGFKSFDEGRDGERHSITVLGLQIIGKNEFYGADSFDTSAVIANEFLADDSHRTRHPEQWAFFTQQGRNLNNSKRYWKAVAHRKQIDDTKARIEQLMKQVERAEVVASLLAHAVKAEKNFTTEERQLLLAEFNGGEFHKFDEEL